MQGLSPALQECESDKPLREVRLLPSYSYIGERSQQI